MLFIMCVSEPLSILQNLSRASSMYLIHDLPGQIILLQEGVPLGGFHLQQLVLKSPREGDERRAGVVLVDPLLQFW